MHVHCSIYPIKLPPVVRANFSILLTQQTERLELKKNAGGRGHKGDEKCPATPQWEQPLCTHPFTHGLPFPPYTQDTLQALAKNAISLESTEQTF